MHNYRIAGIFRGGGGGQNFGENRNLGYFVEKFSWSRGINHTPIHTTRRFVGKFFVVRFSTTKTTKILPLENYPLYGMSTLIIMFTYIHVHVHVYS